MRRRYEVCDLIAGDIVECVDDRPGRPESRVMPDLGGLYTITGVRPVGEGHSVRLKELAPSCHSGGPCACGNCGWDAARFRKVYRPNDTLIARLVVAIRRLEPV
jgi:hypothetical protein